MGADLYDYLEKEIKNLKAEISELRKYDIRELLRCPECGKWMEVRYQGRGFFGSECAKCRKIMSTWEDPTEMLLAWHGREEG